jgi:hypothetical protein
MKRIEVVLAIVFFIVGVVSAVNTVKLSNYIQETMPRDSAQEACQLATLQALRVWAVGRGQIEDAKATRDTALRPLLRELMQGKPVTPEVAADVDAKFNRVDEVRRSVDELLTTAPIPDCRLKLMHGS